MLSDAASKKEKSSKRARSMYAPTNKQWSDSQRVEAVKTYLLIGNLAMTSRMLGIPEITLRVWKRSEWWQDTYNELKTQEKMELSTRLKKIVDASLAVVEDRLLNGDYQFDQKTGQVIRKPVNMKDAHRVAVDLQQRQDVLEKTAQVEASGVESIENKLLTLAEKFAEMATKKIQQKNDEQRTIDV